MPVKTRKPLGGKLMARKCPRRQKLTIGEQLAKKLPRLGPVSLAAAELVLSKNGWRKNSCAEIRRMLEKETGFRVPAGSITSVVKKLIQTGFIDEKEYRKLSLLRQRKQYPQKTRPRPGKNDAEYANRKEVLAHHIEHNYSLSHAKKSLREYKPFLYEMVEELLREGKVSPEACLRAAKGFSWSKVKVLELLEKLKAEGLKL